MLLEQNASVRWHGFDILRLISYFAIIGFHMSLFYWYTPSLDAISSESVIVRTAETLYRALAFSGFTIVLMSSLLLGQAKHSTRRKKPIFLVILFGWIFLSMCMHEKYVLVWDVYTLFLTGMLNNLLFDRLGRSWVRGAGILGFIILWIPIWKYAHFFSFVPDDFQHVLGVASCEGREISEWPALPWIGLIWMGYALGYELQSMIESGRASRLAISKREMAIWLVPLALSVPQWGAYFNIRLGEHFSCEAYRQEAFIFWSHMIWVLAFIRLSVDPRLQSWLAQRRWAQDISSMAISRYFWLAYVLHYGYGLLIVTLAHYLKAIIPDLYLIYELPVVEFLTLTLLLQNELITRGFVFLLGQGKQLLLQPNWLVKRLQQILKRCFGK